MDWEFDEDQLLTYNNPVFVEQCKRRGKDFDKLNTGWVPQRAENEIEEVMDEPEDDEDEDFDLDEEEEDELFMSRPEKYSRPIRHERPSRPDRPEHHKDESLSEKPSDTIVFKKQNAHVPDKPEISMDDLKTLFGDDSTSETPENNSLIVENESAMATNRSKIESALDGAEVPNRPKIILNIDKSKAKPKMKFNLRPKE